MVIKLFIEDAAPTTGEDIVTVLGVKVVDESVDVSDIPGIIFPCLILSLIILM